MSESLESRVLHSMSALGDARPRVLLAFSGGLDSTVLLHLLSALAEQGYLQLRAMHIDHGLQADSGAWADACVKACAERGVRCEVRRIAVQPDGRGTEAAARDARYAALFGACAGGDVIALAHHANDQLETVLLRLFRGAGPRGLAGMRAWDSRRVDGRLLRLWRPLLDVCRDELAGIAAARGLACIEDPSNRDTGFDRNFLRHDVIPALEQRWPHAARAVGRFSANQAAEQAVLATLLDEKLDELLLPVDPWHQVQPLDIAGLGRWRADVAAALVRHWLLRAGAEPSARQLDEILQRMIPVRSDACPQVQLGGKRVRRFRSALYVLDAVVPAQPGEATTQVWRLPAHVLSTSVSLDPALASAGVLHLQRRQGTDSSLELEIRQGDGGAHGVRLRGDAHHHTLKTLWQALGIPVWVRRIVPHVYVDGELVQIVGYTPDEGRYRQLLALASPPFESAGL